LSAVADAVGLRGQRLAMSPARAGHALRALVEQDARDVLGALRVPTLVKDQGLELRVGVHSGDVEIRADDVIGLAVTIAKRICDLARPEQVLVSETVKGQLVGSAITTDEWGAHVLKGVPDEWRLFVAAVAE
jgi:class 3 adenylate cyclase